MPCVAEYLGADPEWPGGTVFLLRPHACPFPLPCFVTGGVVGAGARELARAGGCEPADEVPVDREWCAGAWAARFGGENAVVFVFTGAFVTMVVWWTTGLGFACRTTCTGAWTAATTSPATSFSAGARPEDRAELPPPGSKRSAREIDATASAAGKNELVTADCGFILGDVLKAATTGRSRDKR